MRMMLTDSRDALLEKAMQIHMTEVNAPMAGSPEAEQEQLSRIIDLIREKVMAISQSTGRSTGQLAGIQRAYQMFSTMDRPINQHTLIEQLTRWGIKLTPRQGTVLFSMMDKSGNGEMTLTEFSDFIYPPGPPPAQPYLQVPGRPDNHEVSKAKATAKGKQRETLQWTPVKVLRAIQRKCSEKTKRKSDQVRVIYNMFNNAKGKIDPMGMAATLGTWGMLVTQEDVRGVFRFLDGDGNREIDLTEFAQGVIFKDYSEDGPLARQEDAELDKAHNQALLRMEGSNVQGGHPQPEGPVWKHHMQELTKKIRNKLERKTSKDVDLARQAFNLFCRQGTFTKGVLREQLRNFNFDVSETEIDAIFKILDKDNSGLIDFGEFIRGIMPSEDHNTFGSGHQPTVTARHAMHSDDFKDVAKVSKAAASMNEDWLVWKVTKGANIGVR